MTNYKYMINCGIAGWTIAGNNKVKLIKTYKEYAKDSFECYLEAVEYLGEEPELTLTDFYNKNNFWVEEFNLDYIDTDDTIYELD